MTNIRLVLALGNGHVIEADPREDGIQLEVTGDTGSATILIPTDEAVYVLETLVEHAARHTGE